MVILTDAFCSRQYPKRSPVQALKFHIFRQSKQNKPRLIDDTIESCQDVFSPSGYCINHARIYQ